MVKVRISDDEEFYSFSFKPTAEQVFTILSWWDQSRIIQEEKNRKEEDKDYTAKRINEATTTKKAILLL